MALQIGIEVDPLVIASGSSLSPVFNLGAKTLHGIGMPAAWDAAGLSFQVSLDGGATFLEFVDLRGSGLAANVWAASAGQFLVLDPNAWRGVVAIKVRSGTLASPVNQTADRTLQIVSKSIA